MRHHILYVAMALLVMACANKENMAQGGSGQAPDVPSGVKLNRSTETSLIFQWNQVSGADSYEWELLKGTSVSKKSESPTKNANAIISGLQKATSYSFHVRALSGSAASDWSSLITATTDGATDPGTDPGTDPETDPGTDPTTDPVSDELYAAFDIPSVEEDGVARAFPGAEGGGMYTTGGRGGVVYHVTNLNDNGPGSLRYGLALSGKRTIVFDVAGTIALSSKLNVTKGDVTIAGQTAPGDGICLKNYTFGIAANNVIVRFIRCRMGDEQKTEDDAMQVMGKGTIYNNIIIDHCSMSWSTDECGSFYGMKNFSLQWCILSESLRNSVHGKGSHGYGGLWGGENASFHHNLLAHHDSRNARIDHDYTSKEKGPVSLVNNVIYNWKGNSTYGGESINNTGTYRKYNFVGNYYKPGPATPSNHIWFIDPTTSCDNCSNPNKTSFPEGSVIVPGHFYLSGNSMDGYASMSSDNWTGLSKNNLASQIKSSSVFTYSDNPSYISIQPAQDAFDVVLEYAGASFRRDAIDTRVSNETKEKKYTYTGSNGSTGGLIDTQTDVNDGTWVNGWPVYDAHGEKIADSDQDGMPDWFEEQFGLDKTKDDSAVKYLDKNGRYTNLEMYLHYLVKDIVKGGNTNSDYKKL